MAEPERIRHFSVYLGGKKVGTAQSSSYKIASGDEVEAADGKYFGHSDGATMSTLSLDTIEPVRVSDSKTIVDALLNKKYLKFSEGLVAGQVHSQTMRCVDATFDSDMKAGKVTGKFSFEGGAPEVS